MGNRPNLSARAIHTRITVENRGPIRLLGFPVPSPHYNDSVPFTIRDFQPSDFETLWRIDQDCFSPGISYSRAELKIYMRRRGSFTLVATDAAPLVPATTAESGKAGKHAPPVSLF